MTDVAAEDKLTSQPYQASWIDRLIRWIHGLRVDAWIFHLLLALGLIVVQVLFIWVDGYQQVGGLVPIIIFNALAVPYLLWLIDLLDKQSTAALKTMRPVLDFSIEEFNTYEYRLSNMPILAPMVAGLLMTVVVLLTPLVTIEPDSYAVLQQMPVFKIVFHIVDKMSAFLFGVLVYHTIRQLRLVSRINSNHVRVNLFHIGPLRAFSRLTASTALGLLVFIYPWVSVNPEILTDPILIAIILFFTLMAGIVFAWPLWGVHRLIEVQKRAVLQAIDLRFEEVFSQFNQRFDQNDFSATEQLNGTIVSLEVQQKRINSVTSWPWKSETARLALTAVALPLMLMIIQLFVLQALSP